MALTRVSGNLIGQNTVTNQNIAASVQDAYGWRNRIINGDMRIDQRNNGASVTPTDGQYTIDRWRAGVSAASKFSVQRSSDAPIGFNFSMLCTSLSSYSLSATDNFEMLQFIEGFNTADLAWGTAGAQTVTLSFWVKSSLTGTFGGSIQNSAFNRGYPFTYTINTTNTWEQKSITIEGDTSGTWIGATNGTGISVCIGLGAGVDRSGTAGAWVAAELYNATGAVSVVGTSGATFYITGVQLESGSVATPFERRPFGTELALCQRYFETSGSVVTTLAWPNGPSCASGTFVSEKISFKATKRASPTVTESSVAIGQISGWSNSTPGSITPDFYRSTVATSGTTSYVDKQCLWAASAEL